MRSAAEAIESASHWERLAAAADDMADWESRHARYDGVYRAKAQLYRDAAKACHLEAKTGIPHCACCFKTSTERNYWRRN